MKDALEPLIGTPAVGAGEDPVPAHAARMLTNAAAANERSAIRLSIMFISPYALGFRPRERVMWIS
jgi:hypothetical protein